MDLTVKKAQTGRCYLRKGGCVLSQLSCFCLWSGTQSWRGSGRSTPETGPQLQNLECPFAGQLRTPSSLSVNKAATEHMTLSMREGAPSQPSSSTTGWHQNQHTLGVTGDPLSMCLCGCQAAVIAVQCHLQASSRGTGCEMDISYRTWKLGPGEHQKV